MKSKKKFGLVLSGGGVKGAVHAGMIHYFNEINFTPDIIAGTSTGAIVGSLYAAGNSGKAILDFFLNERPYSRTLWSGSRGIINTPVLGETIAKHAKIETFGELAIPLITVATNMLTGKAVYFSTGDLINPVLASAAFPGVFTPIEINGELYSDGGLQNHFPADIIRPEVDFLIGMHLSPIKPFTIKDLASTKDVLARTVDIQGAEAEFSKLELCDIGMCPEELCDYGTFDFNKDKMQKMFDLGYVQIKKHEKQLINLINSSNE
jgi:NTE family protein